MNNNNIVIYLLVFVRVISFLGTSPIFKIRGVPNTVKAGFGLVLSYLLFGFVNYNNNMMPTSVMMLVSYALGECVFGLALGFLSSLVLEAVRMSGQLMDLQIGFSMINQYDMMSQSNVTLLGNVANMLGLVIFFLIDGHHMLISALIQSFQVVPLFNSGMPAEVGTYALTVFIKIFIIAFKLSAPVVLALLITEFTMGLVARTVPQMNILMLGMPVKVLVGLLIFSAAIPGLIYMYAKAFQDMQLDINTFFKLFPLITFFASGDKTEEATPKKKDDAKKKGQVAKSREFISAITLIGIVMVIISLSNYGLGTLSSFLDRSLRNSGKLYIGAGDYVNVLIFSFIEFLKATAPMFGAVMILGVAGNLAQTGFMNTTETLKPNLSRLNPIEGFKRFFSARAFIEMLKALANIVIVGYITWGFVKGEIPSIIKTYDMDIKGITAFAQYLMRSEVLRVCIIISIMGVADLIFQKIMHNRDLRMTKQEIKEEFKQMEGDPQIKSRIKQRQREMASRRMMQEVPKASVVVTNPTHFAVALKYEQGKDSAPHVVAKGADYIALKIKKLASENNIPVIENKPLARMLYAKVEVDEAIPADMYQAVAEILAYVFSLKKKARG